MLDLILFRCKSGFPKIPLLLFSQPCPLIMFSGLPPKLRVAFRGRKELFTGLSVFSLLLFFYLPTVRQSMSDKDNDSQPASANPTRAPSRNSSSPMPDTVERLGRKYTKGLVIARTKNEDISWLADTTDGSETPVSDGWEVYTYVTDDPTAPYHTPVNKGREAMAYLTYIIDHYNTPTIFSPTSLQPMPEVVLFMHAHRHSWHDNLFSLTSPAVLHHLQLSRVIRLGYMNLRCSWEPGCPDHIHPLQTLPEDTPSDETTAKPAFDPYKPEESVFADAWSQLFPPSVPVPSVLSQPCCAQFALSRDTILSKPLSLYISIRDWLLATELPDAISGRVLEYIWQFIWTGKAVLCPDESRCYCDGYGICFDEDRFQEWVGKRKELSHVRGRRDEVLGGEIERWGEGTVMDFMGRVASGQEPERSEEGEDEHEEGPNLEKIQEAVNLSHQEEDLVRWLDKELNDAKERGKDPVQRAKEVSEEDPFA
ncbi:hypothetical protein DL546_006167 [Coniochaeta pulveracea]|uniref:Uncharacterized protein n=1 Tax=Coniochaeta pulveracea TaxID=177199 RepID=A0A420Y6E9_9PEZI|nr:hypothetical protein DL546_006167 [Coniochaeta pulveracea]